MAIEKPSLKVIASVSFKVAAVAAATGALY
jgi:hypothetical protein